MKAKIVQVFNRYIFPGGEEKSVDRIYSHLSDRHEVTRCLFDSKQWKGPGAPGPLAQLRKLFYNHESRVQFETALDRSSSDIAVFHNIYPIGSPSLYHAARDRGTRVVQFLHNFRPFSVGGTLLLKGKICERSLRGDYWPEVRGGAWQDSIVKSGIFALMLKKLHRSGALDSVKAWIAISDFMRNCFVESGLIEPDRIHTLRHAWDAMESPPPFEDKGYYLFLGRLVPEKGTSTLLAAWDRLALEMGPNTPELCIAGEGPEEYRVRQAIESNPHIRFVGHVNGQRKSDLLRGCRALIAPSTWWEPLGLITYEAYDYRKLVLAAKSGGLAETVQHGATGLLHKPACDEDLANSVLQVEAMTRDERCEWGEEGRRWLLRETCPERWKSSFDDILRTL